MLLNGSCAWLWSLLLFLLTHRTDLSALMFAVQMDSLLNTRALLNASLAEDQQLSANDLLVKAAALAMKTVPDVNASWMETSVRMYSRCDINVVLGVGDGLVAPVVVDAGGKGVKAISDEVRTQQLTYTAQKFVNMSVA